MNPGTRVPSLFKAGLCAVVLCAAPGCTLFDEWLSGDPFTPEQPTAAVELVGNINTDKASGSGDDCTAGKTLIWGMVKNTGDFDVEDVFIEIDAFDAAGQRIGSYRANVFNGDVEDVSAEGSETKVSAASTSLAIDESGTFEICSALSYGTVKSTGYRTSYCYLYAEETVCD